jgi:type IV fimbrial biogenesis protein FimT
MNNYKGFTLMELMVTLAVASILMAVAVPSAQLWQANTRVTATANTLAADLKKARANALVMRRNHTLTAIDSTVSSNQWGKGGWQATELVNGVPKMVLEGKGVPASISISGTAVDSAAASSTDASVVIVGSTGMMQKTDGTAISMTFKVCDTSVAKEVGYNILINQFGRLLLQKHLNAKDANVAGDSKGCNT